MDIGLFITPNSSIGVLLYPVSSQKKDVPFKLIHPFHPAI